MSTPLSASTRTGRLLTPGEVAELLRITPRHVRRLAAAGVLDRVSLGAHTVRYTPESVERLIHPQNSETRAGNAGLANLGAGAADDGTSY